ncbi:MAG TPA: peptidylprolyl isomerase [Anaerolineales bacterium]|nr:peptidylprolyl isomerase [Anaerolineales bacterium]
MANQNENPSSTNRKHLSRMEREARQRQIVLWIATGVALIVVGLLVAALVDQFITTPNRVVAKVGEQSISYKELEKEVAYRRFLLARQYEQYSYFAQFSEQFQQQASSILQQLQDSRALGQEVLVDMIEERLFLAEAEKRGITVSEEEVQKAVEERFGFYRNGTPTPEPTNTSEPTLTPTAGATSTATATLPPTNTPTAGPSATPFPTSTPYTEDGFQTEYKGYTGSVTHYTGISEADFREFTRRELIVEKVSKALKDEAQVETTKQEAGAAHILLGLDNKAQAEEVLARALAGEDFAALAAEFSLDTSNKDNGGDLGTFTTGQMVAPFNDAVFAATQLGVLPNLVETTFGFHIINITQLPKDIPLTADEIDAKKTEAVQAWLDEQKNGTVLQYDWWYDREFRNPNVGTMLKDSNSTQVAIATETAKFAPTATPTPVGFDVTQTAQFETTATAFSLTLAAPTATPLPPTDTPEVGPALPSATP